ncbi:MAG: M48 family metalloprotease [Planctomycetota bacterium]
MRRILSLCVLLTSAALLVQCSTNPATGRSQFLMFEPPPEQMEALGAQAQPQLTQEYGGEIASPEVRSYVNRVGQSLAANVHSSYDHINWQFIALESDIVNAFALPGGRVFISRGLLERLSNESQLAGVLGHEIGHVTGKHVNERISQATALEIGVSLTGQLTESQLALMAANMASSGYQLKFGRDQEAESDRLGVKYLVLAGYTPRGMFEVLNVLREASEGARQPEFMSTHPHPETRMRIVTELLNGDYAAAANDPTLVVGELEYEREALQYLRR